MVITSIVLALIAGIALGYASHQREELRSLQQRLEYLLIELRDRDCEKAELRDSNNRLRNEADAHVSNLQMVIEQLP